MAITHTIKQKEMDDPVHFLIMFILLLFLGGRGVCRGLKYDFQNSILSQYLPLKNLWSTTYYFLQTMYQKCSVQVMIAVFHAITVKTILH